MYQGMKLEIRRKNKKRNQEKRRKNGNKEV